MSTDRTAQLSLLLAAAFELGCTRQSEASQPVAGKEVPPAAPPTFVVEDAGVYEGDASPPEPDSAPLVEPPDAGIAPVEAGRPEAPTAIERPRWSFPLSAFRIVELANPPPPPDPVREHCCTGKSCGAKPCHSQPDRARPGGRPKLVLGLQVDSTLPEKERRQARRFLAGLRSRLARCYEREVRSNPRAYGRGELLLATNAEGRVVRRVAVGPAQTLSSCFGAYHPNRDFVGTGRVEQLRVPVTFTLVRDPQRAPPPGAKGR